MRSAITFLALTVFAAGPTLAQDAVSVDPKHYKVEFENDQVRVLRITYGPREKSVMHAHPAGLVVLLTDQKARFTLADGQTMELDGQAGQVVWADAVTHLPENLTDQTFELVFVEFKRPPSDTR